MTTHIYAYLIALQWTEGMTMTPRLVLAILGGLLDDVVIAVIVIWGLPQFGIHIPVFGVVAILGVLTVYSVLSFHLGTRTLRRTPVPGFTSMVGLRGIAKLILSPSGLIEIKGELWQARSENGNTIKIGDEVEVIAQKGLKLVVRRISEQELKSRRL